MRRLAAGVLAAGIAAAGFWGNTTAAHANEETTFFELEKEATALFYPEEVSYWMYEIQKTENGSSIKPILRPISTTDRHFVPRSQGIVSKCVDLSIYPESADECAQAMNSAEIIVADSEDAAHLQEKMWLASSFFPDKDIIFTVRSK